ncbi:MAG: peptidoglycan DD-metalloendopeptidase family protein [Flavobacteriaceae bacterium]|jgi:murein DD-endopeptidase MepM/ murein hydrolase activator NlpD|nr:peptidoglycan DD-metalloendopeptidase family protein [Pelagibacterales bacterium]MBT4958712.1 peptidoglycan DD-metalloendopeptidase family protein [Flavobacteriaceae bacterium]MBT6170590.1 peptidoglycan DD-metalloendopeptidase family protein [Flavobacteriaceae bacterium]MBT7653823.1 peptidoglycan DD-metalloendopeptidase family protein [Flavobacteriaceae bacterium]
MNKFYLLIVFIFLINSCNKTPRDKAPAIIKEKIIKQFGYTLNDYYVVKDTVKNGDSFGTILEKNNLFYPQIYNIVQKAKQVYDVRKINIGNPYTILFSKDSLRSPELFVYQPNLIEYVLVSLNDSLWAEKKAKAVKLVKFEAEGTITSSLSETMEEKKLSPLLSHELSEIYAWTIDFFRLEKGDNFKIIYTGKYVDDSIYVGLNRIHSAYFEHRKTPFYAIEFETDPKRGIFEYFDEKGKNLRRAFLRSPVQFSRISSRYNLKRKIAYYGYRVRAHKGTDFSAPVGTAIRATASGTVTKSSYTRSNGNYVKIKHNGTYSTQYLHMDKRGVKVGQFVKQGDYIGTVGMTGNTSGPHVCYRFWKNGRQVDPLRQKLPEAKPISQNLKDKYLTYMKPVKKQLDSIGSNVTFVKNSIANNK